MSSNTINPTLSVSIFDGQVAVYGFGREQRKNFSFKGIDGSENANKSHGHIFEALLSIDADCDYFAPSPVKMNAELVTPDQLPNSRTSKHWRLSNQTEWGLYRGQEADGLFAASKQSYVVSAADCALIIVKNRDHIIAAHAGRNSVIDMEAMKGKNPRKNESVVHTIGKALGTYKCNLSETEVWVGFSISAGPHFAHAINDEQNPHNRKMVEETIRKYGVECFKDDEQGRSQGWLDNKELIRRQFIALGIPESSIELDSICTYSDKDASGEYCWYSNKRQLEDGETQARNLFAVVKNR